VGNVLDIKNLDISAGQFRLRNVNLAVKKGEFNVILGPTGSGKTLLLEAIAGLYPPKSGLIKINGSVVGGIPAEKRGISYVPQDLALFPHMNVKQNILFSCRFNGPFDENYIDELIDKTSLKEILNRYPLNLSGGEKQRVALVRALASKPQLLLLDEPLSALHPSLRWELQRLLEEVHRDFNLTVLMVSHDVEEALYLGDVISIIMNGRIHQTGRKKEVYFHPRTLQVAEFFGIRNLFEGRVTALDDDWIKIRTLNEADLLIKRTHREKGLAVGANIHWGIHAEEVTIVKPERKTVERKNLLQGKINQIYERGRYYILLFGIEGFDLNLEINVPDFAMRKLDIQKGSQIEIELNENKIFLIQ
jgi:ABC-type Fe3+/spermidine/putrescine transport system ATPase subunit